jgi:hypothetical protein
MLKDSIIVDYVQHADALKTTVQNIVLSVTNVFDTRVIIVFSIIDA